jgi:probable HAF family extracellular repeat protein
VELGPLQANGNGKPRINAVSGNGSVAVGDAYVTAGSDVRQQPFRWTKAGGYEPLQLGLTTVHATATATNADGSRIAGYTLAGVSDSFLWDNGAVTWIRPVEGAFTRATAMSADGSVVVGYFRPTSQKQRAFRWRAADNWQVLWDGDDVSTSSASTLSEDGTTVVGIISRTTNPAKFNMIYQREGQAAVEVSPPAGFDSLFPVDCNVDGSVIVGSAQTTGGLLRAFRWSESTGVVLLDRGTVADGVNAEGSLIVGRDEESTYVWTSQDGQQTLKEYVATKYGLDLASNPKRGRALSSSGGTIAGGAESYQLPYDKAWIILPR